MQNRPYYNYPPDVHKQYPYTQYPNNPYIQQHGLQQQPQLKQTPYEQFAKPQQPLNWAPMEQATSANFNPEQNASPGSGFKAYFQDEDGQVDFDKMLSTVGQLASTYHQVSPIIKQFGAIIKIFK